MARNQRGSGRNQRRGSGGQGRNGGARRASRPQTNRHFPRTARLNALLQEIVADFFERLDDERFDLVTVAGVEVDNDLNRAQVFVSGLLNGPVMQAVVADGDEIIDSVTGETLDPATDEDRVMIEILGGYRKAVQAEIAGQARLRKTPEVVFKVDPAMRAGARIEEILSSLSPAPDEIDPDGDGGEGPPEGPEA